MSLGTALVVALCGALGSVLRWALAVAVPTARFPIATFAVNVVGAFAIGAVVAGMGARGLGDSRLRVAITAGLLGGFTTFSSFALETVQLLERRQLALAFAYAVGSVVVGVVACWAGVALFTASSASAR